MLKAAETRAEMQMGNTIVRCEIIPSQSDYSAPDECHFRNWRNFLVQPLVLGPIVDTYVESH